MFKIKNKSKKIQKGGNDYIDADFLRSYDNNLTKVMSAIKEYSGKHGINLELAKEFIDNQTSPIRREAAKNLIDNTIYITLQEVYDIVGELIDMVYREFNSNDTIYLYCGKPEKSGYFLCVIALHHIKEKGYKEPVFLKQLNHECLDFINNAPLIILDDVSYTGSQLSNLLKDIYYSQMYIKNAPNPPNIYILLIALNESSKITLSEVPSSSNRISNHISGNIYMDPLKESPFKLIYLEDRLYKPLISVLGVEQFFYLKLVFTPWFSIKDDDTIYPAISLYLDSKIADPVSTFTTTLIYGQIPPSNIDFSFFLQQLEAGGGKGNLHSSALSHEEKTRLLNELPSEYKLENGTVSIQHIIKKFIELDKPDKPSDVIAFKPFINTCNENPSLIEIINDASIQKLDYLLFMIQQDTIRDYVITDYIRTHIKERNQIYGNSFERGMHAKITSIKCPVSWYKKGPFQMVGGKKNKTRRRRNHGKSRKHKK
jgi:hypothetical protein